MTDTTTNPRAIRTRTDVHGLTAADVAIDGFDEGPVFATLDLGPVTIYGARDAAGDLHASLASLAGIGQAIVDKTTARLADLGAAPRVALHFPIGNLEALDEGRTDGWADMVSAPGFDVHISCDGDCFEEWGRPHDITNRTESLHLVATCVATFAEVARVAAFVGSVALVDGDPVATDPADWAQPAALTPKAA